MSGKSAAGGAGVDAGVSARSARGARADVEVRRSARRRRTVSAYREGERIIVLIPSWFSAAEEAEWVERMVARVGVAPPRQVGDSELAARARELSGRYLDGRAQPSSVRWVPAMRTRWASCTPATGAIRLSRRLQEMPPWVRDYVLVHELAHLLEPGHGPRFWQLVQRYPRTERARGYLDGVSAAANLAIADDLADDVTDDVADELADELAG
ncbi:M48 family metallopeptidase [uncultured Jatrophihabitans sp.]|uniref:M48 metallopeptidase family protein n=1 Tax=uncultured Jatrophihabitans sp. TaxID=1610747 RepID=UPI0035CB87AA